MSGKEIDESANNFIPCMAWVRRGVAKPEPERVQISKEELAALLKKTKKSLIEEAEEEDDKEDGEAAMADAESENTSPGTSKSKNQEIDEYNMDNYDDDDKDGDEEDIDKLINFGDLAVYADPRDDPLLDANLPDEEEEDVDDFLIRGTDNLMVVGHVEGDLSTLEVYVYNDVEDVIYVHHDIVLPSFPLALEWLSFNPESDKKGNLIALGTMLSQIQVWDLDIVDCLEPAYTLGVNPSKKKGIKRIGHKDAVLSLSWNRLADHVLASGSVDQTVMIWDLNQKNVASTLKYHDEKVQALAWHPFDQQTLATGCCDKFVRVADCRTNNTYKKWKVGGEVEKLLWNHFNPYQCIVSTDAGTVHAIDVRKDTLAWNLKAHSEEVTGLSLSSQCPGCLVTSSSDRCVKVWDILTDKPDCILEQQLNLGFLQCLSGCPDAPFVVGVGGDNREDNLKVFDIREYDKVRKRLGNRKLENPLNCSEFEYKTANEAEPQESMDAESTSDGMSSLSLQKHQQELPLPQHNIVVLKNKDPLSLGAGSKFNTNRSNDKNKKSKNKKR